MLKQTHRPNGAYRPETGGRRLGPVSIAVMLALFMLWHGEAHAAISVPLQAHEALYTMKLAKAESRSDVVAANGTMYYRFAETCDGWTVENRTVLRLTYEDGDDTQSAWSFASWEASDGRHYRFKTRYEQDGETAEKLSGSAALDRSNAGEARFSEPDDRVIELPAGTLFPTEHIRQLIEAGIGKRGQLSRVVFDGASLDNPYLVSARFGSLSRAERDALMASIGTGDRAAWWVEMAFFPHYTDAEEPEFEISAQYRDDGIADRIVQRFDTFALDVRLMRVQMLPKPKC
jgi:EipB-like